MTSNIQDSSPVDVVKAFIACIKAKDVENMRKLIHPKATACLIRDNEPQFKSLLESVKKLEHAEGELVEVSWDEVEHTDGGYATVWAKFSIRWDGKARDPFPFPSFG